ncbi:MAG: Na+/H+ antiporter subunit G [Candidatus Thermoplasmatota archaeon]|nr:Na+/H+ antiporter subunit G [Candidatus Thermoplasmatota archaeon]
MIDILLSLLILTGAIFTFIGSLGLARLRDFYTRLHGPTKATTLGVGCLLIASAVVFSVREQGVSLHEVLVTLFLFITAPVSAHLLAKAALHLRVGSLAPTPAQDNDAPSGPA